jgi:hypothetical protein
MDLAEQFKQEKKRNAIVDVDVNERGEFIVYDQEYVEWLESKLQNTSSNSDYEAAFKVYCEYDQSNPKCHFDEWLSKRLNREITDFA